jgi:class 3 adenylate cyclase/tetratricopeptide (TPR) repeat protein
MPSALADKVRASRVTIEGERKSVTVLFCDLVGSATIAENLDPEDYRELLDRYLAVVFDRVYRFEGIVNQIAGDGVMALFGAPVAHEDAPERACQAALAVVDAVRGLGAAPGAERRAPLQVRIGINTGPVIVGTVGNDLKMDYTAIGDTTNLASRLQAAARPDTVLVSDATYRLIRGRFIVRPVGELAIRGKSVRVSAYEVVEHAASGALVPPRDPPTSPFVGRDDALGRLEDALAHAASGHAAVVEIVGEAGIGKSRLMYEFTSAIARRPFRVLAGECFSYARGVPYDVFARLLRHQLGIGVDATAERATEALTAALAAIDPTLVAAVPPLARMLGFSSGGAGPAPGPELRAAIFDADARILIGLANTMPVVLVVEDIQWADDASIDLISNLLARLRDARILIVCTHRPEYRPPWSERSDTLQIHLGPLGRADGAAIIAAMVGGEPPAALVDAVTRKAEGNPLFTEEVTRGFVDDGIVLRTARGPVLTRPPDQLDVPVTIEEIVAARLDRLPPDAKRLAQVASVIGRQFRVDLLRALLRDEPVDVDAALPTLEERAILRPADLPAREEYVFHHALTQDVAYQGLLLRQRRQLHNAIGEALEARRDTGHGPRTQSAVLAYHFRHGHNHPQALRHLRQAATEAEAAPSYSTAAALYRQAWDIARDPTESDDATAGHALTAGLGVLAMATIFGEGAETDLRQIGAEVEALADRIGTTENRIAAASTSGLLEMMDTADRFAAGVAHLERALRLANDAKLDVWRWRIRRSLSLAYVFDGRFDEAAALTEQQLDEVLAYGEARTGPDVPLAARMLRDVVTINRDDFDRGLVDCERTYALAVEKHNRTIQVVDTGLLATARLLRGEFEDARVWALRGLQLADAIGSRAPVPNLAAMVVLADRAEGRPVDPRLLARIEDELAAVVAVQQSLRFAVAACIAAGDLERATRVADIVRCHASGRFRQASSAHALGDLAAAHGPDHWASAREHYADALRIARAIGARSVLATALLADARLSGQQGDVAAALAAVDEAMVHFQALGMRWHVAHGERLRERLVSAPSAPSPG